MDYLSKKTSKEVHRRPLFQISALLRIADAQPDVVRRAVNDTQASFNLL